MGKIDEDGYLYVLDRKKRAEGSASRFYLSLPTSLQEKRITASRIYLETLQEALQKKEKIIVDPGTGKPEIWMDFGDIFSTNQSGGQNK